MKALKLAGGACVYFCVATVLAEAGLLGVLYAKGWLTRERLALVVAALDGKAPAETVKKKAAAPPVDAVKQLEQDVQARATADRLLKSRTTIAGGVALDVRDAETRLATERLRFDEMRKSFDQALATLEVETLEAGRQEVRVALENMSPKQAKDHLQRMFDDGAGEDLVKVFTSLSIEKRKKIVGEFRTPAEQQTLHEILREVRLSQAETPADPPKL